MKKTIQSIALYIVGYFGLTSIWDQSKHLSHDDWATSSTIEGLFSGLVLPMVLGAICALVLRPQRFMSYWPIAVAPVVVLVMRILFDDVSSDWLGDNWLGLVVALAATVVISVLAAFTTMKAVLRRN